jgi:RHS repeat-associated protein
MGTAKGFTGQYNDAVTGLDYYGSRYYDPVAGVFLSADSTEGNVAGLNPYGYVDGNPETWTDPTGQIIWCGPGGCGGSSGGSGSLGNGGSGGAGNGSSITTNTNPASWQPGPSHPNLTQNACVQAGGCKVSAQTHEPTLTPIDVNTGGFQQGAPVCLFMGICVVIPAPGGFHARILVQTSQTGLVQICTGTFVCLDEGEGAEGAAGEGENGQNNGALGGDRWYADSLPTGSEGAAPEESLGEAESVEATNPFEVVTYRPMNPKGEPYPTVMILVRLNLYLSPKMQWSGQQRKTE